MKILVNYDQYADVLYLALGKPVPATTDEDADGLAFRFALDDGRPCGVTIMGYKESLWQKKISSLSNAIAQRLQVSNGSVEIALTSIAA